MTTFSDDALGNSRLTHARYIVLAAICAAAAFAYAARNSISVAEESIRMDLRLSDTQMSWVMSSFFFTYTVVQIPTGWLGSWWGTRRALTLFSAGSTLFTFLFASAYGLPWLLISRLGMGSAQSGYFPCTTNTIARWFPATQRAAANGPLLGAMSAGAALGTSLGGALIESIGWRGTFAVFAVPSALWTVWFWWWFRDEPSEHPAVNPLELAYIRGPLAPAAAGTSDQDPIAEPTPWLALFSSSTMWWINGQHFFRAAGYIFFATWFARYLKETRHVTTMESGFLNSLPLICVAIGSLLGGGISDWVLTRTGSLRLARQGVAIGSVLTCAVLVASSYFIQNAYLAVAIISLGSLIAAISGPCAYTITIDMGGRHVAMVFSVMNTAGNVGGLLFPIVAERLANYYGWEAVLFLFAGLYVAAAICWFFVNTRGTVFDCLENT